MDSPGQRYLSQVTWWELAWAAALAEYTRAVRSNGDDYASACSARSGYPGYFERSVCPDQRRRYSAEPDFAE